MQDPVFFDHIEVHVRDIPAYGMFLEQLFRGGRFRQISESGTSMFITPDGIPIEVKELAGADGSGEGGFCLPCIRLDDARGHLEALKVDIYREIANPEGAVYFFRDAEGIAWHAKDYAHRDRYINW